MKFFLSLLFLVLFYSFLGSEKIAVFEQPVDPNELAVSDQWIYVADFPHVYIYSAADFTLSKTVGGEGEGPGQFQYFPGSLVNKTDAFHIQADSTKLVVSSQGKVTVYTPAGIYQSEIRTAHRHDYRFYPVGEKFIALTARRGNDNLFYLELNIHHSDLKLKKEIFRFKRFSQPPDGEMNVVYDKGIVFDINNNKIFATAVGRENSSIDVFDFSGKKLVAITHKYEISEITTEDKNRYLDYYRAGPLKFIWEKFQKQIKFPDRFPGLRNFSIDDDKIYVLTFNRSEGRSEFIILDTDGKFLGRAMIPFSEKDINYYPYSIRKGNLYQLVENEADESWELRVVLIPVKAGQRP